jgi:hypothetical protein
MMRDRPLVTDMPRDKYVERATGARLCKIPHHLATLGGSLLMANDALGLRLLIEELK